MLLGTLRTELWLPSEQCIESFTPFMSCGFSWRRHGRCEMSSCIQLYRLEGFGCIRGIELQQRVLVASDGPGSWCRASKEADKAAEAAAKEERLRVMQARLAAWQAEQAAQ